MAIYDSSTANPLDRTADLAAGRRSQRAQAVKRILVMEDDEILAQVLAQILAAMGYHVRLTKNGEEAIEAFSEGKENNEPFDLIIMDLFVPEGMNGKDAIEKILKMDPAAKTVVTSGNLNDPWMLNFRKFGIKDALPKPFTPDQLGRILFALAPLNAGSE